MDLESNARKELLDSLLNIMVTPNLKESSHSETDDNTEVLYFEDAVATFSSFSEAPKVIKL